MFKRTVEEIKMDILKEENKKKELVTRFLKNLESYDKDKLIRIYDEIRDTERLKLPLFSDDADALINLTRGFRLPVYDNFYEVECIDTVDGCLTIYFCKLDK